MEILTAINSIITKVNSIACNIKNIQKYIGTFTETDETTITGKLTSISNWLDSNGVLRQELLPRPYFHEMLMEDIDKETNETIGRVAYAIDKESFVYYKNSTGKWYPFSIATDTAVPIPGKGMGEAGTFIESFEDTDSIKLNWKSDDFGNLIDGSDNGKWNKHRHNTSSAFTGPAEAYEGDWYLYAETSNGGHLNHFDLSTTNFRIITSLEFTYCMHGAQCGTFTVIAINDGLESEIFSVHGEQGTDWITETIDMTSIPTEELKFVYKDANGWQADLAIDNIKIVSE